MSNTQIHEMNTQQHTQHNNAFETLRAKRLAEATKPFLARGAKVIRCKRCQLSRCICSFREGVNSDIDVILLLHRNEVLKPTNTGRLIADCFPNNTFAYVWARTAIDSNLEQLLKDPTREFLLLFPGEKNPQLTATTITELPQDKKLTVVIIDATWKQARRMYLQSPWLHQFPCIPLSEDQLCGQYGMRKAPRDMQTSTAEAFIAALNNLNKPATAEHLLAYFKIFNQHYLSMRMNVPLEKIGNSD
ncbi:tRNA-uridine aminocarboxypropyltransferase [Sessilibacter sp. MAH1]